MQQTYEFSYKFSIHTKKWKNNADILPMQLTIDAAKRIILYLRFAFLCPCFNYNINKEKLNGTDVDFNSKVTTFGH